MEKMQIKNLISDKEMSSAVSDAWLHMGLGALVLFIFQHPALLHQSFWEFLFEK